MRLSTTLVLFAIASLLGFYISVFETEDDSSSQNSAQVGRVAARVDPVKVQQIEIESASKADGGGGKPVVLTKAGDVWFFKSPIADRADAGEVSALLDLLGHLTIRDEIQRDEIGEDDLTEEALGLAGEKLITVTLTSTEEDEKKPVTATIEIGAASPVSNTVYARAPDPDGEDRTYVVDGNPRTYLENPVESLRDRNLIFAPAQAIVQVGIRSAKGEIELTRKITPPAIGWTMTKPLQTRADKAVLEGLISRLTSLKIERFADETQPLIDAGEPGGNSAMILLRLFGQQNPLSIELAPVESEEDASPASPASATGNSVAPRAPLLRARVSDRNGTFYVRSNLLNDLPTSPNELRDPYLARINPAWLKEIIIQTSTSPPVWILQSSDGQRWVSRRNNIDEDVNRDQLQKLVSSVNTEKIAEFVSDSASDLGEFGLDRPILVITFKLAVPEKPDDESGASTTNSETQSPVPTQMVERALQFGVVEQDPTKLYANFVGEPYVYRIKPGFLSSNIPTHPLKWKDLKIFNFNLINLKHLSRKSRNSPDLDLDYNFITNSWSGTVGGKPVDTKDIEQRSANKLGATLGSLRASEWLLSTEMAVGALQDPTAVIEIQVEEIDPATGQPRDVTKVLRIAPIGDAGIPNFFYGMVDGNPDAFLIPRSTVGILLGPITLDTIVPPEVN